MRDHLDIQSISLYHLPMPFAICGVSEVPSYAATPLDHIISFRDHRQPVPNLDGFNLATTKVHSFVFDDTGDASNERAPSEPTILRLLAIYDKTSLEQSILFHCYAGVSRSSAAAFIWLVHQGARWAVAYQAIVSVRGPFVCPNQLMVKHADLLMGYEGRLAAFLSAELGRRAPEREEYFRRASAIASLPRS